MHRILLFYPLYFIYSSSCVFGPPFFVSVSILFIFLIFTVYFYSSKSLLSIFLSFSFIASRVLVPHPWFFRFSYIVQYNLLSHLIRVYSVFASIYLFVFCRSLFFIISQFCTFSLNLPLSLLVSFLLYPALFLCVLLLFTFSYIVHCLSIILHRSLCRLLSIIVFLATVEK